MKHSKKNAKKKRSSQPQSQAQPSKAIEERRSEDSAETEMKKKESAIHALAESFCYASLDEAAMAYDEAGGDVERAAEILAVEMLESSNAPSTSSVSGDASSSSSGSGSGSSEGFAESLVACEADFRRNSKQKRVVAATGMVSTVIGRHYAVRSPRKSKLKGFDNGVQDRERDEQFLCSVLGEESELSLAVVRDVYRQCGYAVDKALDALLDLTASLNGQSEDAENNSLKFRYRDDIRCHIERSETLTDRVSECSSHSSECELHDSIWSVGCGCRKKYSEVLATTEDHSPSEQRSDDSHLSQKVLESFFNISKSPKYKPSTMDWRNVARKLQSLGPELDVCPANHPEAQQVTYVEGNEYEVFRKPANAQWESVKSCFEKASSAYSKGARHYAAYLSDQGQVKTKLAREADERASKDIFVARNKDIQNVITIDLHGQHVKQAMQMLKMHLLLVSYVQTVQVLRVITGCGTHGMGRSKVKQSVVKLLDNEGINWTEENRGTVLVKLCGQKEFSFLDCESDAE